MKKEGIRGNEEEKVEVGKNDKKEVLDEWMK